MPARHRETRIERLIALELESLQLGAQDLPSSWVPSDEPEAVRSVGDEIRQAYSNPFTLQRDVKNAVRRLGATCYCYRVLNTKKWRASLNGRVIEGNFNEVLDQLAPYIKRFLNV